MGQTVTCNLTEKNFYQGVFPVTALDFSASSEISYICSVFGKTAVCTLQGHNFTKTLIHCRLFCQIIIFKTVNCWSIHRKESLVKPAKSTVAAFTKQPYCFTKVNPIKDFFSRIFQTFTIFSDIVIYVEELNYIKGQMKYKKVPLNV